MKINIPENYGIGGETVKNELAWITPGSLFKLDELLCRKAPMVKNGDDISYNWEQTKIWHKQFNAIEIGGGGSTLFFARRCKSVITFESDEKWKKRLENTLSEKNIDNVKVVLFKDGNDLLKMFDKLENIDVALVDNAWKVIRRDEVFEAIVPKMSKEKAIIVWDNYASPGCFPRLYNWSAQDVIDEYLGDGWVGEDYDSIFWGGIGTRIFHKGIVEQICHKNTCRFRSL